MIDAEIVAVQPAGAPAESGGSIMAFQALSTR